MKIEFPTNLIEFILAGILIEASLFLLIPDLKIESNLFWSLTMISGAYICGLGFNSIATYYFSRFVGKKIEIKKILKNRQFLDIAKEEVESMFSIKVSDNIDDLKKISSLMHNNLVTLSEHYRIHHDYQMRLYRMSRTAFVIVVYWILFLFISGINIIPNKLISTLYKSHFIIFCLLLLLLIFLAIALHLAARNRISYMAGNSFSHFVAYLKMKEKEKKKKTKR